jgi:hypothetical protein
MSTNTNNVGERKIFSAAIAFAVLGLGVFALTVYASDYPGVPKFTHAEIAAAPFFALAALALIVRGFTRSEAPAGIVTVFLFFVLLGGLIATFIACFRIPGFRVC